MPYESRKPRIGDLLFVDCRHIEYNTRCSCKAMGKKHVGLVRAIELDSYGHQRHVLIEWSSIVPLNYREEYGYSGMNIHNCRSVFQVFRNGREIK